MFLYIIMSYGLTHEPARCLFHPLLHFSCRAGDMFGRLFRIGLLAPLDTKKEYQRCVDHDYITVHYRFQRSHSWAQMQTTCLFIPCSVCSCHFLLVPAEQLIYHACWRYSDSFVEMALADLRVVVWSICLIWYLFSWIIQGEGALLSIITIFLSTTVAIQLKY